jgi:hypothetical protein
MPVNVSASSGGSNLDLINKLITIITENYNIHVGTTPPPSPPKDGDKWYNPAEDRYYIYVLP